jgi:hypothetical protein
MARKQRAPIVRAPKASRKAKVAEPKCQICADTMKLKSIIPAAHILPELKTFQCVGCGNRRTVEDVVDLATPDVAAAAA